MGYVICGDAGGEVVVEGPVAEWRDVWEETSFALERLQAAPELSRAEQQGLKFRRGPCIRPMHR